MTLDAENTTATMEIAELQTQRLPLSEVEPHPDNPRIHPPEQITAIQESYRLDGYIAGSMAIQISRKRLYKGHAVYEALSGIGVTHADFVVKELTDAETLALLARDNALSDMSTNDFPKLKEISVKLEKMDVPIERMGQTLESMKELESDWAKSEADNRVIEEDDPPEVSEGPTTTQTGDLWHLGKHRVTMWRFDPRRGRGAGYGGREGGYGLY